MSDTPVPAEAPQRAEPRDAFSEMAARLYGPASRPEPVPHVLASPEREAERQVERAGREKPPERGSFNEMARRHYENEVETRHAVEWDEAPGETTRDYDLAQLPEMLRNPDAAEARAGEMRFRESLVAAGVGRTLARELWNDGILAHQTQVTTKPDEAARVLEAKFGDSWKERLADAQSVIRQAAVKCPEIIETLERTGLGNSPELVMKLAKRARAMKARS